MKLLCVGFIVLVSVIEMQSEITRSGVCKGCQWNDYRFKRAKYYSNPSMRYSRRPVTYPMKGHFYPPQQGYQMDDVRKPQYYKPKVSNSLPRNDGLGDEEISNIMEFLSNQDLDKIVAFDTEKERESLKYGESNADFLYERPNYISNRGDRYENKVHNGNALELDVYNKYPRRRPFLDANENFGSYNIEYNDANINEFMKTKPYRYTDLEPSALFINENDLILKSQHDYNYNRVIENQQISNLNAYALQKANENPNGVNEFSYNNLIWKEEQLPKPSNLREDDFEISYTNNVPTVVKANSNSYKIEDLGTLPLMNYHSKLETVDSYKVPHYTVTSPEEHRAPPNARVPVEPAPPVSTAQQQSDAHLKAIKIWTHKSKGTAYTLHDDGTLSLENPSRPKTYYHP